MVDTIQVSCMIGAIETRNRKMANTHNQAIEALKSGNTELAWSIAQQDEGIKEGVTMDAWVRFATRSIDLQSQIDAAYSLSEVN